MARPGPATQAKRKRELERKAKRLAKEERRALRREQKALDSNPTLDPGADPDLEGIVPGPQDPLID